MNHRVIQHTEPTVSLDFDSGSFRDRTSRVLIHGDRVYRALDHEALNQWRSLAETEFYKESVEHHRIVKSEERDLSEFCISQCPDQWEALLEHEHMMP